MTYNVDMLVQFLAGWFVKSGSWFLRLLGKNGYTWPGHVVNELYPKIWNLFKTKAFPKGIILISGTNGKTTTASLLAHLLRSSGFSVTHNASGANLPNGILTSILLSTNFWGKVTSGFGVFEVDEFHLPFLLEKLSPTFLILTNLSRDQLDRYGETDTVLARWREALQDFGCKELSASLEFRLVLAENYAPFASLREMFAELPDKLITFSDSAEAVAEKLAPTRLVGSFNGLNVSAVVSVAYALGLEAGTIREGLRTFTPAFGRGEKIVINSEDRTEAGSGKKEFYVFLAKNPASFNNNLDMLASGEIDAEAVIFLLNDKIPDGRDVSWIYDIDSAKLGSVCKGKKVYVGGTRSLDMQIRLRYADVLDVQGLQFSREGLLSLPEASYAVLPNYSSMLEFRNKVLGKNIL